MLNYLDHAKTHRKESGDYHYLCRYSEPEKAVQAYLEEHPEIQTVSLILERDGANFKRLDGTIEGVDLRERKIHMIREALQDYPAEIQVKLQGRDPSFQQLFRDIKRAEMREMEMRSCEKAR